MNRLARIRARRAQGIRIRRPPLPAQQPPDRIEATYRRELLGMVRLAQQLVMQRLGPVLQRLEREQEAARQDEALPDAAALILEARLEFERTITVQRAERTAARVGEQLDLFNRRQVARQLRAVLPIDVEAAFGVTTQEIAAFAREGVDLIQSMSAKYFDEVQEVISDGFARGRRASSIAKDINRRGEVSESRARFIARDQVAKLNGRLTQKRQEDLGIERYVWRSSRDSRVRERHRDLDGQTFRWDDPPVVDEATGRRAHPGEDFQCRCRAEPDLDALLDELEATEDLPPVPAQAEAVLPEAARPLVDLEKILPAVPLPRLPGQRAPTWAGVAPSPPQRGRQPGAAPPARRGGKPVPQAEFVPPVVGRGKSYGVKGASRREVARWRPELAEVMGAQLRVDYISHPIVASHVRDLSIAPADLLDSLRRRGLHEVHFGRGGVPDLGGLRFLRGQQPPGWPAGAKWDIVPGAYVRDRKTAVAGTLRSGSRSTALHELGHAVGDILNHQLSSDTGFVYRQMVGRGLIVGDYYLQPGGQGQVEWFAETFARYLAARSRGAFIADIVRQRPGDSLALGIRVADFFAAITGVQPQGSRLGLLTQDAAEHSVAAARFSMWQPILYPDGRIEYPAGAYADGVIGDAILVARPESEEWERLRPQAITVEELKRQDAEVDALADELDRLGI